MSINTLLNTLDYNKVIDDFFVEPVNNNSLLLDFLDYHIANIDKPIKHETGFIF
jgi:hypothetical protein